MAIYTFPSPIFYPPIPLYSISNNGDALTASTHKVAQIIQCTKAGTIDKIGFATRSFTQCTNGAKVSLQDLDSSGQPDGTADQFRVVTVNAANSWFETGLITSDGTDSGTKRTWSVGDKLAVVWEFSSFAVSDSLQIARRGSSNSPGQSFPYKMTNLTGSWSTGSSDGYYFSLKHSDGYVPLDYNGLVPVTAATANVTYNSSSTPDERGIIFQVPQTMVLTGMWMECDIDFAADVVLYDTDGTTALVTKSLSASERGNTSPDSAQVFFTPTTLTANVSYRLTLKPTTTSSVNLRQVTIANAGLLGCFTLGTTAKLTTRTDGGAWTETDTIVPRMGLIFSGINTTSAAERQHAWASFG